MELLELLAGRSKGDSVEAMRRRLSALDWLSCTEQVWERAYALTSEARTRGCALPGSDALIAADALVADATLLHADSDFVRIARWGGLRQESLLCGAHSAPFASAPDRHRG
jgi:predicted nucleic acid-binding protein